MYGSQQIVGWKGDVVDTLDKNKNYVGSHGSIDCHGVRIIGYSGAFAALFCRKVIFVRFPRND